MIQKHNCFFIFFNYCGVGVTHSVALLCFYLEGFMYFFNGLRPTTNITPTNKNTQLELQKLSNPFRSILVSSNIYYLPILQNMIAP